MFGAQVLIILIFDFPFGNIEKDLKYIFADTTFFEEISTDCLPFSVKILLSGKVLNDKEGMKYQHNEDKDHGRDTKDGKDDGKRIGTKSSTKVNSNIFDLVVVHDQNAHCEHQEQLSK